MDTGSTRRFRPHRLARAGFLEQGVEPGDESLAPDCEADAHEPIPLRSEYGSGQHQKVSRLHQARAQVRHRRGVVDMDLYPPAVTAEWRVPAQCTPRVPEELINARTGFPCDVERGIEESSPH